jgi:hypothetical protein
VALVENFTVSSWWSIRQSRVRWIGLPNGTRFLKVPKVITLEWARDYLSQPWDGHARVLTESFESEGVKFTPITKPIKQRLGLYDPTSTLSYFESDNWETPYMPGFPFPDKYPSSSLITFRHVELADRLAVLANQQRGVEYTITKSQHQQQQTQPTNVQETSENIQTQRQEAQPATMAQETPEDIQSNMACLLNEPTMSTDKNFAALHYPNNTQARHLKIWGSLPSAKPRVNKFPSPNKDPAHTAQQFLNQRAESAAYAERQGETAPAGIFTFKDFDDMGNELVTKMTQEEVCILPFTFSLFILSLHLT